LENRSFSQNNLGGFKKGGEKKNAIKEKKRGSREEQRSSGAMTFVLLWFLPVGSPGGERGKGRGESKKRKNGEGWL